MFCVLILSLSLYGCSFDSLVVTHDNYVSDYPDQLAFETNFRDYTVYVDKYDDSVESRGLVDTTTDPRFDPRTAPNGLYLPPVSDSDEESSDEFENPAKIHSTPAESTLRFSNGTLTITLP
jgi:hypothetical protein